MENKYQQQFITKPVDANTEFDDSDATLSPFVESLEPQATYRNSTPLDEGMYLLKKIDVSTAGRTLTEIATDAQVIWGGKLPGDVYGSRDLKGNVHDNPGLRIEKFRHYGTQRLPHFSVRGMCGYGSVNIVMDASEDLRSAGLPTEHITKIYAISEIAGRDRNIPIASWKKKCLRNFASQHTDEPELLEAASQYISKFKPVIIERELQVSARLRDVSHCQTEEDLMRIIAQPIEWLNTALTYRDSGLIAGTLKPELFTLAIDGSLGKDTLERYFSDWLPAQIGIYTARLRKMHKANAFPHAQNWSAVGTMYDLDGMDTGLDQEEYHECLQKTLGVLDELLNPSVGNFLSRNHPNLVLKAKAAFIANYQRELYGENREPTEGEFAHSEYFDGRSQHEVSLSTEEWKRVEDLTSSCNIYSTYSTAA